MCPVPTFPYLLVREKLPYSVPKQVLHMLHLTTCKASIGGYTSSPIYKGYLVPLTHVFAPCLSSPRLPPPVKLPAHSLLPSRHEGHFHTALLETPLLTLSLPTESRTVPFTVPGQRTGLLLEAIKKGKGTKTKSPPRPCPESTVLPHKCPLPEAKIPLECTPHPPTPALLTKLRYGWQHPEVACTPQTPLRWVAATRRQPKAEPPARGHPSPSARARGLGPLSSWERGVPSHDPSTHPSCTQGHPSSPSPHSPALPAQQGSLSARCLAPSSGVPVTPAQLPHPLQAASSPHGPEPPGARTARSPLSPASRSAASTPCCYCSRRPPPPPLG